MPIASRTTTDTGTLWDRFEEGASRDGSLDIVGESGARSMGSLFDQAAHGGAALASRGLGYGSRVGAFATTTYDFVLAALSTWAAGGTFVSLPPPPLVGDLEMWRSRLGAMLDVSGVDALIVSDRDQALATGRTTVPIADLFGSSKTFVARVNPSDPALVQFSSGTTSDPRGILLSHSALLSQFDVVNVNVLSLPGERHMLSWLPLFHDLGFISYLLLPLARGHEATLIPTSMFLRDPLVWLEEISSRRATHSPAPNFAYGLVAKMLETAGPRRFDLSSWGYASSGGEAIDPSTLERFAAAAAPFGFEATSFVPGYGLAEATCIVSVSPPGRGLVVDRVDRRALGEGRAVPTTEADTSATIVSTGPPLSGCDVGILREGRLLGDREVGEILVKAPFVMEGYVADPGVTEAAFWQGWLRTGDLGYLVDGELYVTGRLKDLLVVRGQNLHPEDIERLLIGVPGMRPGTAVALAEGEGSADENVLVVAETKLTGTTERDSCRTEIIRRVWKATGLSPRVILAPPGSTPKTTSGKLRRREALARVRDGRIAET